MKIHCATCDTTDVPFVVGELERFKQAVIHAQCHGRTEVHRMPLERYRNEWKRTGRPLVMFAKEGQAA